MKTSDQVPRSTIEYFDPAMWQKAITSGDAQIGVDPGLGQSIPVTTIYDQHGHPILSYHSKTYTVLSMNWELLRPLLAKVKPRLPYSLIAEVDRLLRAEPLPSGFDLEITQEMSREEAHRRYPELEQRGSVLNARDAEPPGTSKWDAGWKAPQIDEAEEVTLP